MVLKATFVFKLTLVYFMVYSHTFANEQICYQPKSNTTVYGKVITSFSKVDITSCCEYCYKIPECVLSQYTYENSYGYSTCYLYQNVTSLIYDSYSKGLTIFPTQTAPYECQVEENRLFYEITWSKVDNLTTFDDCIEYCTLRPSLCKSWMFESLKSDCLISASFYNGSKWAFDKGIQTGYCTIQ